MVASVRPGREPLSKATSRNPDATRSKEAFEDKPFQNFATWLLAGTRLVALFQAWPFLDLVRSVRIGTAQSVAQRKLCQFAHYRSFAPFQSGLLPSHGKFQGGHTMKMPILRRVVGGSS